VLVAGDFSRTVVFGAGQASEVTLTETCSSPYPDGFVAKYTLSGQLQWVRQVGGCLDVHARELAATAGGVMVLGDRYQAEARFDGGGQSTTLPSYGRLDVQLGGWDSAGTHQWARSVGAELGDYAGGMAVGASGEVYVTGWFDAPSTTFMTEQGPVVLAHTGGDDVDGFVARWEADGRLGWAKAIGGVGEQFPTVVAVAGDGTVLAGGRFTHEAVLGSETLLAETLLDGQTRGFLAGYEPGGELRWAQRWGSGTGNNDVEDAVSTSQGLWMAGFAYEGAVFGDETAVEPSPAFLAEWASDGSLLHVWPVLQSMESGSVMALGLHPDGHLAAAGTLSGAWTFAAGTDRERTIRTDDRRDPMLATWRSDGQEWCAWPLRSDSHLGTAPDEVAQGVAFDEEGGVWVTGTFTENLYLGEGTPGETVLTSAGATDVFVARFLWEAPPVR
jgi:hypothetical protein